RSRWWLTISARGPAAFVRRSISSSNGSARKPSTRLEGAGYVPRHLAGRDQNRIEAEIADCRIRVGGEPDPGCRGDATLLADQQRFRGGVERVARLDLDKNQQVSPARDDIDFAGRRLPAPCQNAETFGDE